MRRILALFTVLMLCGVLAFAQNRTVSGTVKDDTGSPVPFATITETGTKNATTANANGLYSISIKPGGKLAITAVGFQELTVSPSGATQAIILKKGETTLEEVVVTTAGGIRLQKKALGYNTTNITSESLTAAKPLSIASGLTGKVAGLQINSTSSGVNPNYRIVLRGMRSLTGNNEALVVLDNVVVPNSILGNLNPDDISEVVVLNGAGAAALYGSEASNGALIITTKKGTKGKTTIKASNTTTVEQVAFYPKIQKEFGSGSNNDVQVYSAWENQQYGPRFDGVVREIGMPLADGTIQKVPYSATNDKEKFWQNGLANQTDIAVSSGDEKSTLYFSGQYTDIKGTTPKDAYNRAAFRLSGTRKITNQLDMSYGAAYTQNRYNTTTQTATIYDNLLQTPAQAPLTSYSDWKNNPFANPNGYYNDYYNNPYFLIDNYRSKNRNDYFVGNSELKFAPVRWLDFTYRFGITTRNQSNKNTSDKFSFSDYTKSTTTGSYKKADIVGSNTDASSFTTRLSSDFMVGVRQNVQDFNIRLTAGASVRQDQSKSMSASVNGLVVPGLFNLGNSTNTPTASESNYMARQLGAYGDLNIGYKSYLFLHVTGRNDWVSTLAPENRSFFYPSVDVSFIPTDAIPALKDIKGLDFVKLRGGWSKVGQVNLGSNFGAYRLKSTFSQGSGYPYNGNGGFTMDNTLVSANLKPEITTGYEGGFDINMFKERIVANFTYFSTKTKDQTVSTGVSSTTGFSAYLVNTGLTSSKGEEVSLNVVPYKNKDWKVTVGGRFTHYDNKVESISADLTRLTLGAYSSGAGSYAVAGQSFPVLMGLAHKKDPQGRIIVNPITGYPSASDTISIFGGASPKNTLGVDLKVSYKNFTFSALAEYRGGYYIYNAGGSSFDFNGSGINTVAYNRQRFVIPNSSYADPANPGKYIANTNVTVRDGGPAYWTIAGPRRGIDENYVTSADFWKLREVALTYNVPASFLKNQKVIKSATISLQGRNLLILLPPSNVYTDPEYSDGDNTSSGNAIGLTNLGQTPPSRYYGATISLTF